MKNIFLLLLLILNFSIKVNAQVAVTDAYAKIDPSGASQRATFYIELADTNNISSLEVKLGGQEGSSELISQELLYDITTGLPAGFSYSRIGNKIYITSSVFSDVSTYFGSVRIKNNGGTWSDEFKFITN